MVAKAKVDSDFEMLKDVDDDIKDMYSDSKAKSSSRTETYEEAAEKEEAPKQEAPKETLKVEAPKAAPVEEAKPAAPVEAAKPAP